MITYEAICYTCKKSTGIFLEGGDEKGEWQMLDKNLEPITNKHDCLEKFHRIHWKKHNSSLEALLALKELFRRCIEEYGSECSMQEEEELQNQGTGGNCGPTSTEENRRESTCLQVPHG